MKKITLVIAAMLIGLTSATATENISEKNGEKLGITKRYRFMQPIKFVERGVEFLVFPNGEFDFNTEIDTRPFNDIYYRRNNSKRNSINYTYGSLSRSRANYARSRGTIIKHDRQGRVRRVGNVFINYDAFNRVKRVGSVYMNYRHGKLKQVGGLTIQYNRKGKIVSLRGQVNHQNSGCSFCGVTHCSANHFGDHYADVYNDDYWYDDDYYYRKDGTSKKKRKKRKRP